MGWTQYGESKNREQALEECRRLHNWQAEGGARYSTLADGITGHGDSMAYYAAMKIEEPGKPAAIEAAICLISLCPFGYKGMTENMGPYVHAAPLEVLQALEPLPALAPTQCPTCEGKGKLEGPSFAEHAQGRECYICDGKGERDRHDSARTWRKAAWARFGGEPQGQQLDLLGLAA